MRTKFFVSNVGELEQPNIPTEETTPVATNTQEGKETESASVEVKEPSFVVYLLPSNELHGKEKSKENSQVWPDSQPLGQLTLQGVSKEVADKFKIGDEYFLDIRRVDAVKTTEEKKKNGQ